MNKKILAPIAVAIAMLCASVGTTFALLSSKSSAEVSISSGKISVDSETDLNWALSRYEDEVPFNAVAEAIRTGSSHDAVFENTGTLDIVNAGSVSSIMLDRMTSGDQVSVDIAAKNSSNINIKWRYVVELEGELIPGLEISLDGRNISTSSTNKTIYGDWSDVVHADEIDLGSYNLIITYPTDASPEYIGKNCSVKMYFESVQGNATVHDPEPEPEPVTIHLTGEISNEFIEDHYSDEGNLIAETFDQGVAYEDWGYIIHYFTVTYTIPEGTPSNATIICDPIYNSSELLEIDDIYPSSCISYTYKIVDNSGNNFDISNVNMEEQFFNLLYNMDDLIRDDDGKFYIVCKDSSKHELDSAFIPNIQRDSMTPYLAWLKAQGVATDQKIVVVENNTNHFVSEMYYNDLSKDERYSLSAYIDYLANEKGVTRNDIIGDFALVSDYPVERDGVELKHIEPDFIKEILLYSFRNAIALTFNKNTDSDWNFVKNLHYSNLDDASNSYGTDDPFKSWSSYNCESFDINTFFDIVDSHDFLNYSINDNVISGGFSFIWNAYCGSTWEGVRISEAPCFEITLTSNN